MLKTLFYIVAFFAFFSLTSLVVFLFYSTDSTLAFLTKKYNEAIVSRNLSLLRQEEVYQQEGTVTKVVKESQNYTKSAASVVSEAPKAVQEKTQVPATEKKIGPCPDTPPDLVGALLVEFYKIQTLDEVRKVVSPSLQEGGRYKPPDCVAQQKVAIIIPFRNRHEHLKHWLYYLHPILKRQQLDYGVYVINQDGEGIFNRAKLLNVGYVEALKEYDYNCFVFSDVDLVPLDDRNLYRCFDSPRHLAVGMDKFNFQLPYPNFFGGVSSLSKDQFLRINGFPNTYWGWGGEDDDMYKRITFHGMLVSRPDIAMGKYKMIRHRHDLHNEPNPKNPDKLFLTRNTMNKDGINSLKYTVKEIVKDIMYTKITVDINAPLK